MVEEAEFTPGLGKRPRRVLQHHRDLAARSKSGRHVLMEEADQPRLDAPTPRMSDSSAVWFTYGLMSPAAGAPDLRRARSSARGLIGKRPLRGRM